MSDKPSNKTQGSGKAAGAAQETEKKQPKNAGTAAKGEETKKQQEKPKQHPK